MKSPVDSSIKWVWIVTSLIIVYIVMSVANAASG